LSEIVTAQPTVNGSGSSGTNGSGSGEAMVNGNGSEPVLTGTGPLKNAQTLLVKQRIRACEILSLCLMCEVEKKYNIYGADEEILYTARERSNCLGRYCLGSIRGLSLEVCDQTGRRVMALSRPFNCAGLCCGIAYPHCTQSLKVIVNEETAGVIRERATWCYPVYHVSDSLGSPLLKIRGPLCHYGCCGTDVQFQVMIAKDRPPEGNGGVPTNITSFEGGERCVATVTKKWGGLCTEALLEADSFVIHYTDPDLSVEEKSLILSSAFLIDFNYFEAD